MCFMQKCIQIPLRANRLLKFKQKDFSLISHLCRWLIQHDHHILDESLDRSELADSSRIRKSLNQQSVAVAHKLFLFIIF